ncbi:MAG: phosphonate C-P lyase system protein PhnG [Deltaproteobacteria bacterium]|nr:phosphonate C-P lyase system protein PhnG [Deltaproteobacteria bacterium]
MDRTEQMDRTERTELRESAEGMCPARASRAFALSDRESLISRLESVGRIPDFEYLRAPQKGLIMVRGRAGGAGRLFNLCEALATRCSVRVNRRCGHAYVLGDDPAKALAAALASALYLDPDYSGKMASVVLELEGELDRKRELARRKAMETKVEFFTLARGEDDD